MSTETTKDKSTKRKFNDLLKSSECPICHTDSYKIIWKSRYPEAITQDDILKVYRSSSDHKLMDQLVECKTCHLIYLNPVLNEKFVLEGYASAEDPTFVEQNSERMKTFERVFKKILKTTDLEREERGQVLDIGCASGAFLKVAKDLGFKTIGVEPSRWMCEYGKKNYGLDLRPGTLFDHPFEKGQFQIITLWDVIEHLISPDKTLKECARLLSDEGILVINFPDYGSVARKLLQKKWPFFLSVHLYYFTRETMTKLLQNAGFTVVETKPHWQTLQFSYVLKRAKQYIPPVGLIEKVPFFNLVENIPLTYNVGQTLMVAVKDTKSEARHNN